MEVHQISKQKHLQKIEVIISMFMSTINFSTAAQFYLNSLLIIGVLLEKTLLQL
jgi:hypothetical protein